jgi:hypothetical protein
VGTDHHQSLLLLASSSAVASFFLLVRPSSSSHHQHHPVVRLLLLLLLLRELSSTKGCAGTTHSVVVVVVVETVGETLLLNSYRYYIVLVTAYSLSVCLSSIYLSRLVALFNDRKILYIFCGAACLVERTRVYVGTDRGREESRSAVFFPRTLKP